MLDKYKEYITAFKELSFRNKVIYIITTLILTLIIMFVIYSLIHLIMGLIL